MIFVTGSGLYTTFENGGKGINTLVSIIRDM